MRESKECVYETFNKAHREDNSLAWKRCFQGELIGSSMASKRSLPSARSWMFLRRITSLVKKIIAAEKTSLAITISSQTTFPSSSLKTPKGIQPDKNKQVPLAICSETTLIILLFVIQIRVIPRSMKGVHHVKPKEDSSEPNLIQNVYENWIRALFFSFKDPIIPLSLDIPRECSNSKLCQD